MHIYIYIYASHHIIIYYIILYLLKGLSAHQRLQEGLHAAAGGLPGGAGAH